MDARFPTTRVSLVLAAAGPESQARDALASLCLIYWYPLYAYVRRWGYGADEAQDLTQGFLTRLIEKRALGEFAQGRGRFRSFLLASLKHFLANERAAAQAWKRGGGAPIESLDVAIEGGERRYSLEPRDDRTPEKIFEKQWALAVLQQAMGRLREEYTASGKGALFARLEGCLGGNDREQGYRELARELGMTEGSLKVAVHRMRRRFHEVLRDEISYVVASEKEIGEEIGYLISVLRG